jgi:dUTP pyrophosphatase
MSEINDKIQKLYEDTFKVEVKVLDDGRLPVKANRNDTGFDVFATSDITIYPGQVMKHPLNIRCKFPIGAWAEIAGKSGLGAKGLLVYSGIVDSGYRGIPHVVMSNINLISHIDQEGYPVMRTEPIVIKKGDKVAQLIMNPYNENFYIEEVEEVDTNTSRAEGGFGSTGR